MTWHGWDKGTREYSRITLALFAAGFATFAQIFDAQAVLPALSRDLGVGAAAAASTVTASTLGVAVSVLPWAAAADRIGRTRAMAFSLISATVIALVIPFLPGFGLVVVGRAVLGVALGAVPAVAMAYLAEELVAHRVAIAAGIFVSGNTFGGIYGRIIAGPMSEAVGWRPAMFTVAVTSAVMSVIFVVVIPKPRGFRADRGDELPVRARILVHLRDPVMVGLYALGFLLMGAFGAVYNYFGYRLQLPPYSIPASLVGFLFAVYLFGTVASRYSGVLVTRFGAVRVIVSGTVLMLVGLGLMLTPVLAGVIAGLIVFTIGCFTAHPVASGQSGIRARVGRAQATALYQLAWLGGTALMGLVAGVAYDAGGWSATVAVAAVMCVLAIVVAVTALRRQSFGTRGTRGSPGGVTRVRTVSARRPAPRTGGDFPRVAAGRWRSR